MIGLKAATDIISDSERARNLSVELGPNAGVVDIAELTMNPFLGVSLGNKIFYKRDNPGPCIEYIRDALAWGLQFSRDQCVLAVIGDAIHAINLEHADGYTRNRAVNVAERVGGEVKALIEQAVKELPSEDQARVIVSRWHPLVEMKAGYWDKVETLRQAYATDASFKEMVQGIVGQMLGKRSKPISDAARENLSEYIIQELALLAGGVRYEAPQISKDLRFDLLMYPSLGDMQNLIHSVQGAPGIPRSSLVEEFETDWLSASVGLGRPALKEILSSTPEQDEQFL